jgi:hypothetical protein
VGESILEKTPANYRDLQPPKNGPGPALKEPEIPRRELELVDVSIVHSTEGQPSLDLKFRNIGNDPVFITNLKLIISFAYRLKKEGPRLEQLVTWIGNLCFPDQKDVPLSQVIAPKGTDRIQIRLYSKGRNAFFDSLYECRFTLTYNGDKAFEFPKPVTLLIFSQTLGRGKAVTTVKNNVAAIKENAAAIKDFVSRDTVRDPSFEELVKRYREDGLLD